MKPVEEKAKNLKIGSVLEVHHNIGGEMYVKVKVRVDRCTDSFVWYKGSGLNRVKRTTIDRYPTLYKIISI